MRSSLGLDSSLPFLRQLRMEGRTHAFPSWRKRQTGRLAADAEGMWLRETCTRHLSSDLPPAVPAALELPLSAGTYCPHSALKEHREIAAWHAWESCEAIKVHGEITCSAGMNRSESGGQEGGSEREGQTYTSEMEQLRLKERVQPQHTVPVES